MKQSFYKQVRLQGDISFTTVLVIFIGILSILSIFPILSTIFAISEKGASDVASMRLVFSNIIGYIRSDCIRESGLIFPLNNFKFLVFHYNKSTRFIDKVYFISLDEDKLLNSYSSIEDFIKSNFYNPSICEIKKKTINEVDISFIYCNSIDFINDNINKILNSNSLSDYYLRYPILVATNLTGIRNFFFFDDFINIKYNYFKDLSNYDKSKIFIIYTVSSNGCNNYTLYLSFCKFYSTKGYFKRFEKKKFDSIVGLIIYPVWE